MAWGILAPHPGFEPSPSAVEVLSLNHWTTREAPFPSSFSCAPKANSSGPSCTHWCELSWRALRDFWGSQCGVHLSLPTGAVQVQKQNPEGMLPGSRVREPEKGADGECVCGWWGGCLCKIGKAAETTQFAPTCNHLTVFCKLSTPFSGNILL